MFFLCVENFKIDGTYGAWHRAHSTMCFLHPDRAPSSYCAYLPNHSRRGSTIDRLVTQYGSLEIEHDRSRGGLKLFDFYQQRSTHSIGTKDNNKKTLWLKQCRARQPLFKQTFIIAYDALTSKGRIEVARMNRSKEGKGMLQSRSAAFLQKGRRRAMPEVRLDLNLPAAPFALSAMFDHSLPRPVVV